MSKLVADCLISIGSNLGDRSQIIDSAIAALDANPAISVRNVSTRHVTQPAGGPIGQGAFFNAVAVLETSLPPLVLLNELQAIESRAGRKRDVRWEARSLDLDLLLYGDLVSDDEELVLPHPRMAFRRFVLEPANEVAPTMGHPVLGRSLAELLEHLNTAPSYIAITGVASVGKSQLVQAVSDRTAAKCIFDTPRPGNRLEASTSPSLQAEIELLNRRSEDLFGVDSTSDDRCAISDFWLGQSLAFAKQLPPNECKHVEQEFRACAGRVASPKLIVFVEFAADQSDSDRRTETQTAIQRQLHKQILAPGLPPILRLNAANPSWNEEEVVAAILAM